MNKIILLLLCAVLLCGCGADQKLSDKFDPEQVKAEAEEVIGLVNEGEYGKLVEEKWDPAMKSVVGEEALIKDIKPVIDDLGEFESFDKEAVTGTEDKDTDRELAVAIIKAKYEKRKAQFTITFDEDMRVAGFFIK